MELTDREIRNVGFNRYYREHRGWVILALVLLFFGWIPLVGWLLQGASGGAALLALSSVPVVMFCWYTWRANKAGKRFFAEWKGEQTVLVAGLWCSYCAGQRFKVLPDLERPTNPDYSTTWECVECGAQFDDNPGNGFFTSYWGDKNTSDTPMKYNPNTGKLVTS